MFGTLFLGIHIDFHTTQNTFILPSMNTTSTTKKIVDHNIFAEKKFAVEMVCQIIGWRWALSIYAPFPIISMIKTSSTV